MSTGYQRELKYRHEDGSFSAYGPRGAKPGSTWLTAFVVKSFAQASPYVFIDQQDLNVSIEYLKSVQNPEDGPLVGCFFERYVSHISWIDYKFFWFIIKMIYNQFDFPFQQKYRSRLLCATDDCINYSSIETCYCPLFIARRTSTKLIYN